MTRPDSRRSAQPALIIGLTAIFILVAVVAALMLFKPAAPGVSVPEELDGVGLANSNKSGVPERTRTSDL